MRGRTYYINAVLNSNTRKYAYSKRFLKSKGAFSSRLYKSLYELPSTPSNLNRISLLEVLNECLILISNHIDWNQLHDFK